MHGGPHTSSHPNYTWGTPGINNCDRQIRRFPFRYRGNLISAYWSIWSISFWSPSIMELSGWAKRHYFSVSVSCDWDPVQFSLKFLIMPESPPPLLGRDVPSKVHATVFMNMVPSLSLPLIEQNVNPRVWADGKSVGWAQHVIPVVLKLKDPYLFPHKKQ